MKKLNNSKLKVLIESIFKNINELKDVRGFPISDNQRNRLKYDSWGIYDDTGNMIIEMPRSYGSIGENRPPCKVVRGAGRAFTVCYYHDGGVQFVQEIED